MSLHPTPPPPNPTPKNRCARLRTTEICTARRRKLRNVQNFTGSPITPPASIRAWDLGSPRDSIHAGIRTITYDLHFIHVHLNFAFAENNHRSTWTVQNFFPKAFGRNRSEVHCTTYLKLETALKITKQNAPVLAGPEIRPYLSQPWPNSQRHSTTTLVLGLGVKRSSRDIQPWP